MLLSNKDYNYSFDPIKCESCEGNCCIGESGYIWIKKEEQKKLATFLDISKTNLIENYLIKVDYKYSIKEKQIGENNFACIFFDLEQKRCSVYDARPSQCRTFPFWEYFKNNIKEVQEECPAIVTL